MTFWRVRPVIFANWKSLTFDFEFLCYLGIGNFFSQLGKKLVPEIRPSFV